MSIDIANFTPGLSLTGGLVIGAATAVLVLFNGRIAGISGIVGGFLSTPQKDAGWRVAFLAGLIGAPVLASLLGNPIAPSSRPGGPKYSSLVFWLASARVTRAVAQAAMVSVASREGLSGRLLRRRHSWPAVF